MTDLLVLPRYQDPRAALAEVRAGNVRTLPITAFNYEILSQLSVDVPIIVSGVGGEARNYLKRNNRVIPINGATRK